MNEVAFVRQREPDWKRLNMLCDKADLSPKNLTQEELKEIVVLYRRASSDLSLARTQSGNLQLVDFLNDIVGRAYLILYRPVRGPIWRAISHAVQLYASVARRRRVFIFAAAATFFLGMFFSAAIMRSNPDLRHFFVAPQSEDLFSKWKQGDFEQRTAEESFMMTGFYASNNPFVSIVTGSVSAATFGILTCKLLWDNGVMLGALGSDMASVGKLGYLVAMISPHGMSEIQGIFVAGGAGYLLGWTMIFPGRRKRGDALKEAAKDGLVLLCGGICLMFIAAPFEGFFSFSPVFPSWVKLIVAGLVFTGWFFFYRGVGRNLDPIPAEAA